MGVCVEYETEISIFSFRELETNIFIFSIWKSAPIRALETFLPSNAAIIVTFSYGTLRAHFFRHPYNDFVGGSKEGFRLSTSNLQTAGHEFGTDVLVFSFFLRNSAKSGQISAIKVHR